MNKDSIHYIKDTTREGLSYWRDLSLSALIGVGVSEGVMTIHKWLDTVFNYHGPITSNVEVIKMFPPSFVGANAEVTATGAILLVVASALIGTAWYRNHEQNRKKQLYRI